MWKYCWLASTRSNLSVCVFIFLCSSRTISGGEIELYNSFLLLAHLVAVKFGGPAKLSYLLSGPPGPTWRWVVSFENFMTARGGCSQRAGIFRRQIPVHGFVAVFISLSCDAISKQGTLLFNWTLFLFFYFFWEANRSRTDTLYLSLLDVNTLSRNFFFFCLRTTLSFCSLAIRISIVLSTEVWNDFLQTSA